MIIAPEIDLPNIDAELATIAANHEIVPDPPLTGYVTAEDVAHETNKHTCDAIIFACHGDDLGLTLSDGHCHANLITQFVRNSEAGLCVLNACNSERLAQRIYAHCNVSVIYARTQIDDAEAMLYMVTLSKALAVTDDYAEAYRRAGSQGGRYRIMEAKEMTGSGAIAELAREVNELAKTVTELRIEMSGLRQELNSLKEKNAILPEPAISPVWLWLFLSILVLIATGIGLGLIR